MIFKQHLDASFETLFSFHKEVVEAAYHLRAHCAVLLKKEKNLGKIFTFNHFIRQGIPRSTLYRNLNARSAESKCSSERIPLIITKRGLYNPKIKLNNKDDMSQRDPAAEINCHRSYISKMLRKFH